MNIIPKTANFLPANFLIRTIRFRTNPTIVDINPTHANEERFKININAKTNENTKPVIARALPIYSKKFETI